MNASQPIAEQNAYGITYVTLDGNGLRFESERVIHLTDGTLTTLKMPTQLSERLAIQQLVCDRQAR
ncbi:hypothetical protein FBY03_13527 [Pseudomonas sp. SJZ079]|uniref:type III secretion system co-regulatory protein PtrC n=1 Tax=Pseudomonas sp. SJZ079 TaxID=2572887 RepID=UPI00119B38F1|nr:type III secretion system co-regulatory protein PtrC [Pseudomonas sp. SJZ079]TWC28602.1 hypothetical protein FBY03_13527 [Pseudomonas sp. SJZ079]